MQEPTNTKCSTQNESVHSSAHRVLSDSRKKESTLKSTNEDVQRAIEGLKEIPDEELQEFLNDEDFMEGLDVVDAWEGDEEKNRECEPATNRARERDQKRLSRDRHRRDGKGPYNREKPKREEKKREEMRRDPSKSTKDIERDKMRTKRDNESKLLAEKEKAIKHLLDSDDVVPPGTETEAIQSIAEKQNQERAQMHVRRSRERRRSFDRQKGSPFRRRSPDRSRVSPPRRRSPFMLSPERRKSPFKINIERHRSPYRSSPVKRRSPLRLYNYDHRSPPPPSPERRRSPGRRPSWDRRPSVDRRWSLERHRRRADMHERRRSRSRERHRSRSMERLRRRGSRSPTGRRYSPRRWASRSRSRSRSVERRTRKRSPFINELARQLRKEAIRTSPRRQYGSTSQVEGIPPLMNQQITYQQEAEARPPVGPTPYIHQPPVGTPMAPGLPVNGGPPFMNFEVAPQGMNFEPVPLHPMTPMTYSCEPVMYNQPNDASGPPETTHRPPLLPAPVPSPQPVPAPTSIDHQAMPYNSSYSASLPRRSPTRSFESSSKSSNTERNVMSSQSYRNGFCDTKEERLKTPEPPVISDTKQFEKTSLSSLLEASVSAKDSVGLPVLYPGFKPEILRHCEHALRELPIEDPRLKMKGRFFYDPKKDNAQNNHQEHLSNSILLQKTQSKIYWEEEEERHVALAKQVVQTHQKICQTEVDTDTKFVQATVTMVDSEVQVYPHDLQQSSKEEKRPIMDRLDWSARETFDYTTDFREAGDLRWSLSNSSQKRSWTRTTSPRRSNSQEHRLDPVSSGEHAPRSTKLGSPPIRSRNHFVGHKGPVRDHYVRERYSPPYRQPVDEREDFHDSRSDRSRGESPMMLEDSGEELEVERTFQRRSDWHGRGKPPRGRSSSFVKTHIVRGKHPGGRPYRGRSTYRGKY